MVAPGAPRKVTILGSTGSIGCSTIDLIEREPERFEIVARTANTNVELLADQARRVGAGFAAVADPAQYRALSDALGPSGIACAAGAEALVEAAERQAEWVMAGIVGAAEGEEGDLPARAERILMEELNSSAPQDIRFRSTVLGVSVPTYRRRSVRQSVQ